MINNARNHAPESSILFSMHSRFEVSGLRGFKTLSSIKVFNIKVSQDPGKSLSQHKVGVSKTLPT